MSMDGPNKEAIAKWVEALESDEFQGRQTRGKLITPKGQRLCAIGVRNHVYMREVLGVTEPGTQIATGHINMAASRWVGMTMDHNWIGVTEDGKPISVVQANDKLKMTFSEIAQHLRKTFL